MSALEERGDHGKGRADQIKMLQLYDLTAAAAHDPALRLPHLKRYAPKLDRLIRSDGARLYSPERVDTLQRSQRLSNARDATPLSFTTAEWRRLIFRRPLLYLQDRAEIFRWVFLTPKIERCVPFLVGVSGPPAILGMLDIAPRYDRRDARIEAYAQRLVNTPIFSHAFFVILGLAAGIVLMRRRSPSDIAMVFLLVAAGLFVLTFFVISLACDYRYLYLLDVAAMAAAIHVASAPLLFARFTER
jgi:hypothetical protein